MTQTQTAPTPEQEAIQKLEKSGYRIVKDGQGIILVSGKGRNSFVVSFDSAEAAVERLLRENGEEKSYVG